VEAALCCDDHEQRGDTGVTSDVYECLFLNLTCTLLSTLCQGLAQDVKTRDIDVGFTSQDETFIFRHETEMRRLLSHKTLK